MASGWRRGALGLGPGLILVLVAGCGESRLSTRAQVTEQAKVQAIEPPLPQDGVAVSSAGSNSFQNLLISGDTAFVGDGWVFRRTEGKWQPTSEYDSVLGLRGFPTAASDDRIVMVSSDRVFAWERAGDAWSYDDVVVWTDYEHPLSHPVALSGETLFVRNGAAVLVFVRSGITWSVQQTLVGSDSGPSFGGQIAVSAEQVLILGGDTIYVFTKQAAGFQETQKLVATDGGLPYGLAASGNVAVLASSTGLHSFVRSNGVWSLDATAGEAVGRLFDFRDDLALVDTKVYQVSASGWRYRRDFMDGGLANFFSGRGRATLATAGLFDGGALFGLNISEYVFDGLRFPAEARLVSVEVYSEPETCSVDSDCTSSRCIEGVCCRTECSGTCKSCLASRKGAGPDGECGNVEVGTDPLNSCAAQPESSCGTTGQCDGKGECSLYPEGTPCEFGYLCAPGACRTSCEGDGDCDVAHGYACLANTCQAMKPPDDMNSGGGGGAPGAGGGSEAGSPGDAGSVGSGGAPGTGGSAGNTGSAGDPGSGSTSGGEAATGGKGGAGAGIGGKQGARSGGGGCSTRGRADGSPAALLVLFAAALLGRRRVSGRSSARTVRV